MDLTGALVCAFACFLSIHVLKAAPISSGISQDLTTSHDVTEPLSQSQLPTVISTPMYDQSEGQTQVSVASGEWNMKQTSDSSRWAVTGISSGTSDPTTERKVVSQQVTDSTHTPDSTSVIESTSADTDNAKYSSKIINLLLIKQTTRGAQTETDESDVVAVNQGKPREVSVASDDDVDSDAHAQFVSTVGGEFLSSAQHSVLIVDDAILQAKESFLELCHDWCQCKDPQANCSSELDVARPKDEIFLRAENLPSLQEQTLIDTKTTADVETQQLLSVYTVTYHYSHFVDVIANGVMLSRCGSTCDVSMCVAVAQIPMDQSALREFCRWRNLGLTFNALVKQLHTMLESAIPDGSWRSLQTLSVPTIDDGTNAVLVPMYALAAVAKEMVKVREVMERFVRPSP